MILVSRDSRYYSVCPLTRGFDNFPKCQLTVTWFHLIGPFMDANWGHYEIIIQEVEI